MHIRAPEMTFTPKVQESSMGIKGNVKANHEKLTLVFLFCLFALLNFLPLDFNFFLQFYYIKR